MVETMLFSWIPACQAISARQRRPPCHVFSSTEEKSHSFASLINPSSIFSKIVKIISLEKDEGSDNTIRETAFAAVYRTIVSLVSYILEGSTLSDIDDRRKSRTFSRFSVNSMSIFERTISIIPTFCITLTRSFLASALDWIVSDSVRRRISIASEMIDWPTCLSE